MMSTNTIRLLRKKRRWRVLLLLLIRLTFGAMSQRVAGRRDADSDTSRRRLQFLPDLDGGAATSDASVAYSECVHAALAFADANGQLSKEDYPFFLYVISEGAGSWNDQSPFDSLPKSLQDSFDALKTAEETLDFSGIHSLGSATTGQQQRISLICSSTREAIQVAAMMVEGTAPTPFAPIPPIGVTPSTLLPPTRVPTTPAAAASRGSNLPGSYLYDCRRAISYADVSRNNRIEKSEYVRLLNKLLQWDKKASELPSYDELDPVLQASFEKSKFPYVDQRTGLYYINVAGSIPGQKDSQSKLNHIIDVCSVALTSITRYYQGGSVLLRNENGGSEPAWLQEALLLLEDAATTPTPTPSASTMTLVPTGLPTLAVVNEQATTVQPTPKPLAMTARPTLLLATVTPTLRLSPPTSSPRVSASERPGTTRPVTLSPTVSAASSGTATTISSEWATEQCHPALIWGDDNRNNRLEQETEYLRFLNRLMANEFQGYAFTDLDPLFQTSFEKLKFSRPDPNSGQYYIDVRGIRPGRIPTEEEARHLHQVCLSTLTAMENYYLGPPTSFPTTVAPSTVRTTVSPTTEEHRLNNTIFISPELYRNCTIAMFVGDSNRNLILEAEATTGVESEFVRYLNRLYSNQFAGLDFDELPRAFQEVYAACENHAKTGINVHGSRPGQNPTESQVQQLTKVCNYTQTAFDTYLAPTVSPTVSLAPTSLRPTTAVPSLTPGNTYTPTPPSGGPAAPTTTPPPTVISDPAFVFCLAAMQFADLDASDFLDQIEFIIFLEGMSAQLYPYDFSQLDPRYQELYAVLSMGNEQGIDVQGSKPEDDPTSAQTAHLQFICVETSSTVDVVQGRTKFPTPAPTRLATGMPTLQASVLPPSTLPPQATTAQPTRTATDDTTVYSAFTISNDEGLPASGLGAKLRVITAAYELLAIQVVNFGLVGINTTTPAPAPAPLAAPTPATMAPAEVAMTPAPSRGATPSSDATTPTVASSTFSPTLISQVALADCLFFMDFADLNRDDYLNQTEYIYFLEGMSFDALPLDFSELDPRYQENYQAISNGDPLGVNVAGSKEGEVATSDQLDHLVMVCTATQNTVNEVQANPGQSLRRLRGLSVLDAGKASDRKASLRLQGPKTRKLQQPLEDDVIAYKPLSAIVYQADDLSCPSSVQTQGAACQTVYASYEILLKDADAARQAELQGQYQTLTQKAISLGDMQAQLTGISGDLFGIVILGATEPLQPPAPIDPETLPTTYGGLPLWGLIVVIIGSILLLMSCGVAAYFYMLVQQKEETSRQPPPPPPDDDDDDDKDVQVIAQVDDEELVDSQDSPSVEEIEDDGGFSVEQKREPGSSARRGR